MDRRKIMLVLATVLLGGLGRERRVARSSLPNLAIPVDCASEIMLLHCDARTSPPKCESARVKFRKGCERILVNARTF
jgi:hypothetical protein